MTTTELCLGLSDDHPFAPAERLFRRMAVERLDRLSSAWIRIEREHEVQEAMADVRHIAHVVAGTAPSLGHPALGVQADRLERMVADGSHREDVLTALRPFMTYLADIAEE